MKTCAFLTANAPNDIPCDDHLTERPLADLGWRVVTVPWRSAGEDPRGFRLAVIRSAWDYQDDPQGFLAALRAVERAGIPVANPPGLVAWNMDKIYLRDFEAAGIPIVPTLWGEGGSTDAMAALFDDLGAGEVVIKPRVGASALDTFRLTRRREVMPGVVRAFAGRDPRAWMAQPFVESIVDRGEFSLFYFDGELSHAIVKRPARGDFRVQEEYGGKNLPVPHPAGELREVAEAVLGVLDRVPLYARVDLAEFRGEVCLMELELIEPSLYFSLDSQAPGRFARALARRYP